MKIEDNNHYPVGIKEFKFPDGQVHVKADLSKGIPYSVYISACLKSGDDVLSVLLANEALRHAGVPRVELDISYLLGARMDRRIAKGEPFTLKVIAELLRGKFDKITVLDPHSDVACALLDADPILPTKYVDEVVKTFYIKDGSFALCAPDAGATKRVEQIAQATGCAQVVQCLKHRDMKTGKLSGFKVMDPATLPRNVLIVDDISDGGGTFTAIGGLLKSSGVKKVGLYVTHGIFSKGFELENIDHIYTTTSYRQRKEYPESVTVVGPDLF